MSVIVFELKQEHLLLLKHLRWSLLDEKMLVSVEDFHDEPTLFGTDNIYEGIDLILNGKPSDFDPNSSEIDGYDQFRKEWDKLLAELPTALEIVLHTQNFVLGTYKARFHEREWKLITGS